MEWRALHSQVIKINGKNDGNCMEFQVVTNCIEEVIVGNNHKFAEDYKAIHACIDCKGLYHSHLKKQV